MSTPARSPTPIYQPFDAAGNNLAYELALSKILSGESPLKVHYQPIADLVRGQTAGYEALVHFPGLLGHSMADCFTRAALRAKRFQLEEVITLTALQGKDLLPPNCFLSLNVSIPFLLSKHWENIILRVPDFAKIVIELKQEGPIEDDEILRSNICLIRTMGGFIAVDDAASGYTSLHHILEIKPDFIKLDSSLIKECNTDAAKSVLIEMIGQAANRLDAWIVAEGVETPSELHELIHLQVPLAQGDYIDRPHPEMRQLAVERGAEIRSHSHKPDSGGLLPHLEVCPVRSSQQAARHLLTHSTATAVIVVDPWNRPVHIIERHPLIGIRGLPELMKAQLSSSPKEALNRSLTRPVATRFDPFAVIDDQGTAQGIIRIDRLSRALLSSTATPDAE